MILSIWVFFVLGDSLVPGEPPAYEQVTTSAYVHRVNPGIVQEECEEMFHEKHPHHVVCDSGWCQQSVQVMGR